MRKTWLPVVLVGSLALGSCQYAGLAPVLAEVVNEAAGKRGYADEDFGRAAAEACRGRAARHGRVSITSVEQQSSSTMRVRGTIEDPYRVRDRGFVCLFRSDGRIAAFRRDPRPE